MLFRRMVVAGVGLIGGSLGLAARRRSLVGEVVGFGRGEENLRTAMRVGAIDRYSLNPNEAAREADLVVLAVPVRSTRPVAEALLPATSPAAAVIDVGSVKAEVVNALEALVKPPAAFVGCHPIAGTEHSGAAHAFESLFEGHLCILTPTERTDPAAVERVTRLWEGVGMKVESMTPDLHDRLLALVSHLPHAVAYSLVLAIEDQRVGDRDPLEYSGGGLRDTTRIAASHPEKWRDIYLSNRREILRALDLYEAALHRLRGLIQANDANGLGRELARLRAARARLVESKSRG